MAFRLKELVFIGNSLYPAEIVGFPEKDLVEVKWLESAGVNWECIFPLSSVKSMQGRRTRTRPTHFTQGEDKKKKRSAPSRTTTHRTRRSPRRKAVAKSYQPRKIATKEQSKKPPPNNRNKNATVKSKNGHDKPCPPKKRQMVASLGQSVARMPNGNDADSSSSSDEELLEQARRQRTQRASSTNEDRKPAAKPTIRLDFSSFDDSDDDNIELLKPAAMAKKSFSVDSTSIDDDVDSSDDDADFARTRATSKDGTGQKPVTKRRNKGRGGESDTESASDQDASRKTPNRARVKQEHAVPLMRDTFKVKDHVWVREGNKKNVQHPAIVTQVLGDDFLEIQWADGFKMKKKVPKNIVSLMFDLTTNDANNEGRPRRSTRARHQPERHGATPVKKEKESKERSTKAKKPRSKGSKTKNVARRPKSRKKVVASDRSDIDTDTERAVQHNAGTNIGNPVILLDSSDNESESGLSVFSVATFEYTAPGVDPKFRSLHNITNLDDFNRVQSWKQKEDHQNGNADMQPVIEGTHEGTPDEERDTSPNVAREGTTTSKELQVATAQHSSSATGCSRLSLDSQPFMFDKERGTSDGGPLPGTGIQARAVSLDEPPVPESRRESNETANPDDLPDILLSIESEGTVNEDRLTADTQELSQAFAAFGDCDFE